MPHGPTYYPMNDETFATLMAHPAGLIVGRCVKSGEFLANVVFLFGDGTTKAIGLTLAAADELAATLTAATAEARKLTRSN